MVSKLLTKIFLWSYSQKPNSNQAFGIDLVFAYNICGVTTLAYCFAEMQLQGRLHWRHLQQNTTSIAKPLIVVSVGLAYHGIISHI